MNELKWKRIRKGAYRCQPSENIVMEIEDKFADRKNYSDWKYKIWIDGSLVDENSYYIDTLWRAKKDAENSLHQLVQA